MFRQLLSFRSQFLLMLKKRSDGVFTVNWYPLAPVNEQIHSADDPWLLWVRRQAKEKNRKPFRLGRGSGDLHLCIRCYPLAFEFVPFALVQCRRAQHQNIAMPSKHSTLDTSR